MGNTRQKWRWVDRIDELDRSAREMRAKCIIDAGEWYLAHHFPGFPVLPGVLLVEAMAHSIGLLQGLIRYRAHGQLINYVLARVMDARFYHFVEPGDHVVMQARIASEPDEEDAVEGVCEARVGERRVARAKFLLHRLALPEELREKADPFSLLAYLQQALSPELRAEWLGTPETVVPVREAASSRL